MAKRTIAVEIDCEDKHCGKCAVSYDEHCRALDEFLEWDLEASDYKRCEECIKAEHKGEE